MADSQVCGVAGIYQNGRAPFYLPTNYFGLGTKPGTTQGSNRSFLGNPDPGSLEAHPLFGIEYQYQQRQLWNCDGFQHQRASA
jgi:hypothetical protein